MRMPHKSGTVNEKPVDRVLGEHLSIYYGMMGWDPGRECHPRQAAGADINWAAEAVQRV